MFVKDFIRSALNDGNNSGFTKRAETLYGVSFPQELAAVVSKMSETVFFEGDSFIRLLSQQELLDASSDMQVDFIAEKIVPLFDTGDNDYIAYDLGACDWCKFNIVDEVKFTAKSSLLDYFN